MCITWSTIICAESGVDKNLTDLDTTLLIFLEGLNCGEQITQTVSVRPLVFSLALICIVIPPVLPAHTCAYM